MSLGVNFTADREGLLIQCNPFHVLGVSTRDNRQRIVEAAEEKSLTLNVDVCATARGDLTNPRNRLAAELAWLPGISPRRAQQLVEGLERNPAGVFSGDGLPPLAHANLMASAMLALDPALPETSWVVSTIEHGKAVDAISAETVLADINQDRAVAGFTEVKSVEAVEEGLGERRREYRDCLSKALDKLPPQKLAAVATKVVEIATERGTTHPPVLIDDMIDAYAVGAHAFLSKEAANIQLLIDRARQAATAGAAAIDPLLQRLEQVVGNWCAVARPIQLVAGAKGTSHDLSLEVAGAIRSLSLFLYNTHTMLDASQRITRLLQKAFGSLPELAERAGDDARALDDLVREKQSKEKIKPLYELCNKVLEEIDGDPLGGDSQARRVLDGGNKLIPALAKNGLDPKTISDLEDIVAVTVLRCAIALGNASSKWEKPIGLLEEARPLAHDKEILERIDTNLATARKNQRLFANLKPISSPPPLFTINGCGVTVYGFADPDKESGSHMVTYYFVLLAIPIFPICRYRVIPSGNGYRFLGKAPLRTFDKWHLAAAGIGILYMLFHL